MYVFNVTQSLEIILAGAPAANQMQITGSFVEIDTATLAVSSITAISAVSNSGIAVTLVAAPAGGRVRILKELTVYNADTANATITIQFNDSGTVRPIVKAVAATLYTISYNDNSGWK